MHFQNVIHCTAGTLIIGIHYILLGVIKVSICSNAKSSSSSMVRASDRGLEDLGAIPSWISISLVALGYTVDVYGGVLMDSSMQLALTAKHRLRITAIT